MTKADVMEHWDDRRLREGEGEPKGLIHRALQASLETELTDRLGYERHAVEGQGRELPQPAFPNTVRTEIGAVEIKCPSRP